MKYSKLTLATLFVGSLTLNGCMVMHPLMNKVMGGDEESSHEMPMNHSGGMAMDHEDGMHMDMSMDDEEPEEDSHEEPEEDSHEE